MDTNSKFGNSTTNIVIFNKRIYLCIFNHNSQTLQVNPLKSKRYTRVVFLGRLKYETITEAIYFSAWNSVKIPVWVLEDLWYHLLFRSEFRLKNCYKTFCVDNGVSIRILRFPPEYRSEKHMASASISAIKTFVQSEARNLWNFEIFNFEFILCFS